MKNILFIIFLIAASEIACAQPYQSIFGKDSTTWVIEWSNTDLNTYANFTILSDTIYQSKAYKVVGFPGLNFALIREDTLTGQIWSVDLLCDYNLDGVERLVADMSLQVGDSFNANNTLLVYPTDTFIVVDSVYYIQGQKRIRFSDSLNLGEPITFYEGIGPNYSLLWKVGNDCSGYTGKYLLCVFKDGVKADYTNLAYNGDCSPDLPMGVESVALSKINISPNPAMEYLNVTGVQDPKTEGIITNAIGQQVGQYNLAQGSNTIPLNNLPSGYYQISFYLKGITLGVQRFVKM